MPTHKSHLTAITRRSLPAPIRWLLDNEYALSYGVGSTLDYGCGKCASINPPQWDNYDPHFAPDGIKHKDYYVILCTYVLCVLTRKERMEVLEHIQSLLSRYGSAYISVRNDKPKHGWGLSKRQTYQGRVGEIPLPLIHSNAQFRIYHLTKTTNLK